MFVYLFSIPNLIGQTLNDENSFNNYTYSKEMIINNKIATVTINTYFPNGTKITTSVFYFDTSGILLSESTEDYNEKGSRQEYFIINKHKDLIETITKDLTFKRIDTVFYFKEYKDNKLVKDSSTFLNISDTYKYNKSGILVERTMNSPQRKHVVKYNIDSSGKVGSITETDSQNGYSIPANQCSNRDIVYNSNGKKVQEIEKLNSNNSWMANNGTITYDYDKFGNLIQINKTNESIHKYTYNEKGLLLTDQIHIEFDDLKQDMIDKYTYSYFP